jgi:hypothetical protein
MCKAGYKRLVTLLGLSWSLVMLPVVEASAQGTMVPGYTGRVNNAIGGVIGAKVNRWGFAANDPRYTATNAGVATGLSIVAMGIGGTVAWPVVLAAAGIGAVVAAGVAVAAAYNWKFNADGTVTVTGTVPGQNNSAEYSRMGQAGLSTGGAYYIDYVDGYPIYSTASSQLFQISLAEQAKRGYQIGLFQWTCEDSYPSSSTCAWQSPYGNGSRTYTAFPNSPYASPTGFHDSRPPPPPVEIPATTYASVTEAVAAAPSSVKDKPVTAEAVAAAANAAWKAAASPNESGGLPWSASYAGSYGGRFLRSCDRLRRQFGDFDWWYWSFQRWWRWRQSRPGANVAAYDW